MPDPTTNFVSRFPQAVDASNLQHESGQPADPYVRQARDYNIHDQEIRKIQQVIGAGTPALSILDDLNSLHNSISAVVTTGIVRLDTVTEDSYILVGWFDDAFTVEVESIHIAPKFTADPGDGGSPGVVQFFVTDASSGAYISPSVPLPLWSSAGVAPAVSVADEFTRMVPAGYGLGVTVTSGTALPSGQPDAFYSFLVRYIPWNYTSTVADVYVP
jgi:hypothetical protein